MDAEGYPAQCASGAGKGSVSASVKKKCVAALLSPRIGRKKLPAEPFSGALPGVSVTELLAIESVFAISSLYDSFLLLQIS